VGATGPTPYPTPVRLDLTGKPYLSTDNVKVGEGLATAVANPNTVAYMDQQTVPVGGTPIGYRLYFRRVQTVNMQPIFDSFNAMPQNPS
jgi:hypothetical protein